MGESNKTKRANILRTCNEAKDGGDWAAVKEQLDTLDLIKRLNQSNAEARPWIIWMILFVAFVFLILAFIPRPTTEVAMDLRVTKIEFSVGREGQIFQQFRTNRAVVSNAASIEDLANGQTEAPALVEARVFEVSPVETAAIAFDQVQPGASAVISIAGKELLTILRTPRESSQAPKIRLFLASGSAMPKMLAFSSPHELQISAKLGLNVPIELVRAEVDGIRFLETDVHPQAEIASFSAFSPIQGGHLDILDLENKPLELRKGDSVTIRGAKGHLSIDVDSNVLLCHFVGVVNDISAGRFTHEKSLRPTMLQWLSAKYSFLVALSVLFSLLPVAYTGLVWLNSAFRR